MRPRAELALSTALVLALAMGAGVVGARRALVSDADQRRSTLLTGPSGASGYVDALERLGVRVESFRRPPAAFEAAATSRSLLAVLGPSRQLGAREGLAIARLRSDLLLAGPGAGAAIRCFGYDVRPRMSDSLTLRPPSGGDGRPWPYTHAVLARRASALAVDSSDAEDGAAVSCLAPSARTVDTLLRTASGRPVVLRTALDDGRTVTLVADDRLFSNRVLRESGAGPFALGLVVPRYSRMIVDEYHHGFDASRSLAGATWEWTRRSPWGWAILQLVGAGVLALLAAGVRFGPICPGPARRRRSAIEHVRALATALAAARGHDVAVGLLVQGLRRRLSRQGRTTRGEVRPWLDGLAPGVRTPRGREALANLTAITAGGARAEDVLQAAHAVETLWEELTPT